MVTENYVSAPVRRVKRLGFVPMQRPIVFCHRGYKEALDILLEDRKGCLCPSVA